MNGKEDCSNQYNPNNCILHRKPHPSLIAGDFVQSRQKMQYSYPKALPLFSVSPISVKYIVTPRVLPLHPCCDTKNSPLAPLL